MNKIVALAIFILFFFDSFSQSFDHLEYRHVGPYRGGRVTTVCGVEQQSNVFYQGSTGGGVWKTSDFGQSWNNISDGFFKTPSIGAISVFQKDPNIIYVGTGSDGLRSNVIAGKGMYKSTDAGKTWEHIGLEKTGQIGAVEIDPDDPSIVYVAAIGQAFNNNKERGVYKTVDGGKNWTQVLNISDQTGFCDLEIAPGDPKTIFATAWRAERKPWTIISGGEENGIYKSTDAGENWVKIDKGLPNLKGKIDLSTSLANPDLLYALVEAQDSLRGLYLSEDRGESFTLVSNMQALTDRPFYYTNVKACPQNPKNVYVMSTRFHHSTDGGKTWKLIGTPHGDHHDLWINPLDSNLMVQCNDGGANISFNKGKTWSYQFNQPTAEIYQVEVDNQYPYWLYGGQQDNYTTIAVPSLPPSTHQAGSIGLIQDVGGCETGPAVPHPTDPDIVYSNCKGRFGVFNKKTGQEKHYDVEAYYMYGHNTKDLPERFQRVAPIHISPHDSKVIYHCSQHVWKTENEGVNWEKISPDLSAFEPDKQMRSGSPFTNDITGEEFYSTIYSIRESSIKKGLLWVGANDGPVHVSINGGTDWKDITPKDLPKGGRVDSVEPSDHDENKAYITVLRYLLGDWTPYIYKTENLGKSWTLITNGLPKDNPVRVVREDQEVEGVLYAGTEFGMFVSLDDGKNWQSFQQNLPITPITDIKLHRGDLILSTMGRGFWIMDDVHNLLAFAKSKNNDQLFKPNDAIRYRYRGFSQSRSAAPSPSFPGPGVNIDYFLANDQDQIKLEIVNAADKVIRSFTNQKAKAQKTERDMATNIFTSSYASSLSSKKGHHRFRWNFRQNGAWHENEERAYSNGPYVAPGTYKIRLNAGGKILEEDLILKMDPRLQGTVSHEDLIAQEKLCLEIIELISESRKATCNLKKSLKGDSKANPTYEEIYNKLVRPKGRYTQPMFISQLTYLYGIVSRADQLPGNDAYKRFEQLKGEYEKIVEPISMSKE